jgi:photosystem II stability/assembly factor-like uncharacterized protein
VLRTLDGGATWSELRIGKNQPFFDRVTFYDARHGWLVGRDEVYYTEDGGQSWQVVVSLPPIQAKGNKLE